MRLLRKASRTWYFSTTSFFDWLPIIKRDCQGTEIWIFNLYLAIDWNKTNENNNKNRTCSDK